MLVFQTVSSSLFLPSQTVAEGSEQSVFTEISFTDEEGKAINIEEIEGESTVNVHVDWSTLHVEVEAEYTESLSLPEELLVEEEQQGVLIDGETEVGAYQAAADRSVMVIFSETVSEYPEASGSFVIQAESRKVEDEEVSSEVNISESKTNAVKDEDESVNEETDGTEEEAETTNQEGVEEKAEYNSFAGNDEDPQQITENIIDELKLIREDGSEYEEGDLLELDEDLSLDLSWSLPSDHGYHSGDTFEFQLPEALRIYNVVEGELDDYGKYHVTTNGEVTLTFNERIESDSGVRGTFWVETELNEQVISK